MKSCIKEIVFNQENLNTFCQIMNLKQTIHDDLEEAQNMGYRQTVVPVIYVMSTTLSILNDCVFPDWNPLELYREYTCIRPVLIEETYLIEYILNRIDNEQIGVVDIRVKNQKKQICIHGFVKLKLINKD